jgi:hypothetical protein
MVLTSSAASNYPLVLSQALFTKRRGLTDTSSINSMSAVKPRAKYRQVHSRAMHAPPQTITALESLRLASVDGQRL